MSEEINLSNKEIEQVAAKSTFWVFTGKWAIIIIFGGAYLIYDKQYLIGILLILASIIYI